MNDRVLTSTAAVLDASMNLSRVEEALLAAAYFLEGRPTDRIFTSNSDQIFTLPLFSPATSLLQIVPSGSQNVATSAVYTMNRANSNARSRTVTRS